MLKDYLNKKTIYLGITATAVAGFSVALAAPAAATLCRELNLAGISIVLDNSSSQSGSSIIGSSVSASGSAFSTIVTSTGNSITIVPASLSALQTPASGAAVEVTENVKQTDKKGSSKKSRGKRRVTVKKQFRTKAISIASDYVNIRKEPNIHSKIKGKLYEGSAANILKTKGDWVKIESGNVTGYVKKSYLAIGADAQKVAEKYGRQLVSVKKGVTTLNVREEKSTKAPILTQIPEDEMYEASNVGENWVKIVVDGDTKGFVAKEYVDVHIRFKKAVSGNTASGSSGNSGSHGSSAKATGSTGSDIANYALNFVGNPYKWGGTSLTNGADCSGFVQSIYAQYGYRLPRTSREQSGYGKSVSLSQVQPGDLIFYKHGSSVGHVALYIGGGRVVHAASSTQGIITSNMNYNQPYCARRIV